MSFQSLMVYIEWIKICDICNLEIGKRLRSHPTRLISVHWAGVTTPKTPLLVRHCECGLALQSNLLNNKLMRIDNIV